MMFPSSVLFPGRYQKSRMNPRNEARGLSPFRRPAFVVGPLRPSRLEYPHHPMTSPVSPCMLLQPQRNCKLWLCPSWLCLEVTGLAEPCPMATRTDTRRGHFFCAVKAVAKTHVRMLRVNSAENPSDSRWLVQFQGRWSRGYPNLLCLLCLKAVANSNDLVNYGEKNKNLYKSTMIHKHP